MRNIEAAEENPWPLYDKWWLSINSKPHPDHESFDLIEIFAEGPDEYKRVVTSIMVPKIDGLVCESHSFIASLIHQNVAYERERAKGLVDAIEDHIRCRDNFLTQDLRMLDKALAQWRQHDSK